MVGTKQKIISIVLSSQNEMEYHLIYRLFKPLIKLHVNYEPAKTMLEFVWDIGIVRTVNVTPNAFANYTDSNGGAIMNSVIVTCCSVPMVSR